MKFDPLKFIQDWRTQIVMAAYFAFLAAPTAFEAGSTGWGTVYLVGSVVLLADSAAQLISARRKKR